MSKEQNSGKWAAEAYDFIKLFQRTGEQISGLFLLELGWTLLVVALVKLSPQNTIPFIELPTFSKVAGLVFKEFHLSSIYSTGVIGILIMWLFASKLSLLLFAPLRQLLRQISIILVQAVFWLIALLELPIYIPSYYIEQHLFKRWKKKQDQQKLKEYLGEYGEMGEKVLLEQARKDIKFNSEWFIERIASVFAKLMQTIASSGYIGFASIQSVSFEEERKATQLYSQAFASAINMLKLNLTQLRAVPYIKFISLPSMIVPRDVATASFLKGWFGLDILIWGSYVSESQADVWLNIQHGQIEKNSQKSEVIVSFNEIDIFPGLHGLNYSSVVIQQNNVMDAYIVLLVAVILGMRSRMQPRFRLHAKDFDLLQFGVLDEQVLLTLLIRDVLFSVPVETKSSQGWPTSIRLLVDLAGRWVSNKLTAYGLHHYDPKEFHLLKDVAYRCTELAPDDAAGYYRLSMLFCLINDYSNAHKYLKIGMEKDKKNPWLSPASATIRAETEFARIDGLIGINNKIALARFAMCAARAVVIDINENAKTKLAEKYKKQVMLYGSRKLGIFNDPLFPSELIVQEILELDLSPDDKVPQT